MCLKLVACDLDETLMDGVPIKPETRDFLVEIQNKGIKFVINSGRSLNDILNILSESKFPCPQGYPEAIISLQGVFIHYLKGNNYAEDEEWNREKEKELEFLRQEIGWKGKSWEILIEEKLKIKPIRKDIDYGVFRVFFNSPEEAEKVRQILLEETDFKYTIFLRNKYIILVSLSTAQKGFSLLRVAQNLGISPHQVLTVGDSHNDEDMLNGKYGFIPAAPSNAEEEIKLLVKANKGHVASLPEGKGVVEIVKFLLNCSPHK